MMGPSFAFRIYDIFCSNCKYRRKATPEGCPICVDESSVCVRFEWKSEKAKSDYQKQVLHNQAVTLWLEKGKPLDVIWKMREPELLSILKKYHYTQFEEDEARTKEMLAKALGQVEKSSPTQTTVTESSEKSKSKKAEKSDSIKQKRTKAPKKEVQVTEVTKEQRTTAFPKLKETKKTPVTKHYFYTVDKIGRHKTFWRNIECKTYQQEVIQLRKHFEEQNITVLEEKIIKKEK